MVGYQSEMWHSIQSQVRIGSPEVNTGQCYPFRREAFADNKNYPKRLLYHPMLEIKHTQPSKNGETQKREQLIAPLHQRDVSAREFHCQSAKNEKRLSDFIIVGRVRAYGRPDDAHH